MAEYGWYNSNQYRDYPFIYKGYRPDVGDSIDDSGETLPRRVIVDFRCLFGPAVDLRDARNIDQRHIVYLYEIRRQAGIYEFEFRTTVEPADQYALIFDVPADADESTIVMAEAVRITEPESSDDAGCEAPFVWEGCLVVGIVGDLNMVDDDVRTFTEQEWQVEPATIQAMTYLQTVNLANHDRTRAYSNCITGDFDPVGDVFPNAQCLVGPLWLKEGFNCAIRQDDIANSLIISAVVGAGAGQPCDEIPLYADESAPSDSLLLSGGPACSEIIATINGIGGRYVRLVAGAGVSISRDPDDPHGLLVVIDLNDFTVCLSEGSAGAE